MRRLNVLTWHTHGSYLYYLAHTPHEFHVLSKPGRPPGYGGRCGPFPIRHALLMPRDCVIPELTVLPMQETSWP